MATCEQCGNDYDKSFAVTMGGRTMIFDSFECHNGSIFCCGNGCPFRKFHPARIRIVRQNHRIIDSDACDPARARHGGRRLVQVAVPT